MKSILGSGLGVLLVVALSACSGDEKSSGDTSDAGSGGSSSGSGGASASGGSASGGRATGGGAATGGRATGGGTATGGTDGGTDGSTGDGSTGDGSTGDGSTGTAHIKFCHDITFGNEVDGFVNVTFNLTIGEGANAHTFSVISNECSPDGTDPCIDVPAGAAVAVSLADADFPDSPLSGGTIELLPDENVAFYVTLEDIPGEEGGVVTTPVAAATSLAGAAECTAYDADDIPVPPLNLVVGPQSVNSSSGYLKR